MFEAARVGDDIGHSGALAGMIAGTIVGGLIAAAGGILAGAMFIAGLGASCLGVGVLLVGASLAVGYYTGELATAARDSIADAGASSMTKKGVITSGSPNVFINSKPAAIATDSAVKCSDDGSQQMAEGSKRVSINSQPASRIGDRTTCDAKVMTGSDNVFIGGDPQQTLPIQSEVPEWLYKVSDLTLLFAGLLGGWGGAAGKVGALSKLLGKIPGINKLARIACRAGTLMTGVAAAGIIARPVDIVSGQKFLSGDDELDFVLPSRLPVRWQRYWRSGNPGDSVLGRGWSLFWESRLEPYQDGLVWRAPSGDYVAFPNVPKGMRTYCESEKNWLEHHHDDSWSVYDVSGERWHYAALKDDAPSLLQRISEPCGNDILFEWNADNTLHALTDSAGQRVVCRYDRDRLASAWLDDEICLVSYAYDEQRQLVCVTGRGGSVRRRFRWQDGLMSAHEDANGLLSEYRWREIDGLPRVVGFRHSGGEQQTFEYDFENGIRRAIRDDGAQAHWLIDDDDNVARFTDYDGRQTTFVYRDGELSDVILPGGAMRCSTWDKYGRMTSETDPAGRRTEYYWYRLTDRITRTVYPDGTSSQAMYDLRGRLLSETDPAGNATAYHYPDEEENLPESITDALGGVVRLVWNIQGLLTQRTDCSGSVTRFSYDRFGQLIASEDAEGNITRREWNNAGLLSAVIHPDGSRESLVWNERGQLTGWRDPLESEVSWAYNALGLPVSLTDRIGRVRQWRYDPRGNLLGLDNGNGAEYRFTYDAVGRPLSETRPDETVRHMEWDARGFLCALEENGRPAADGGIARRVQQFSYDDSGLLIGRTQRHAEYRYVRDLSGQITRIRRTPTAEGVALGIESDEIAYRHDAAGRVLSESGINGAVGYEWDALSNLTGLTLPGEQKLAWLHYGSGHVSAIRFGQQLVTEFTRDRLHREVRRTQGAREQLRQYDSLGRRTLQRSELSTDVTLPEQALLERLYRYTARGELSGVSDTLRGEVDYGYDAEGRLLKHYEARQGHSRAQFSYDAADNLAANDDAVPVTDNRLQHWQALFMKYDHWGNLVSRRNGLYEQHYAYDADNRLVSARGTGPEGRFEARYHYDALGRRTRKIVTTAHGTTETRFLWQGYRLLQEQQESGLCSTYIYDPNEAWSPLARVDHLRDQSSGEIYWFNTDLNGAPLEVTDERGAVRWSGQYGSFGEVRHQSEGFSRVVNRTAMAHQPLRYAGQYADGETGLHYNLFRYYDPQVGRFIVQDPIGLAGGNLNLYHYAPNPLVWIDPMGLALSGVDFSGSPSLYPVTGTQRNIVEITLQGSRGRDFTEAYKLAGISEADASEYTWHHLDDFDPKTGKSTMQLVTTEAHKASFPHKGSVSQFEKHFGVKYGSPEAIKISHSKGWLRGRIPKHCQ
ncbi:RHS repeat-associated core domain-containing protein [Enterobacter cloacae]|uniref:RHS repeat-associated core domain-containing protein n=1 Tax=Enterobacter cloacae TaxID=550 RepID=UPI000B9FBD88|nr:RHS repeat-associated core domain-containing protein [Enterobacter cloacae]OZU93178.1 type IV secretion protein Rhs [Enterobacter cloacae]PAN85703.1 type IV secretion protein Rhs [Enterobacter cloacae]PAN97857.1 type IV secretion protein Rhs [Enterobacter cloacae]HAS1027648.1 type IV secretion protein Rhs [Enterobacter cloacae]HAS1034802.1 type IV secretion protein Rhs [Enterobacter cloacae]